MGKTQYYTEEGLQRLKDELLDFETVKRPDISRQIGEARDKGDLSENAEYDAAKEAQGLLELAISKLATTIRNARIMDESQMEEGKIYLMSKVKITNLKNNASMAYLIVPEKEADLRGGKISVNSPIAKGLLGKCVGDTVDVQVPAGAVTFRIDEISR